MALANQQVEGAAMGSSMSLIAANLHMQALEKRVLETLMQRPNLWIRHVDDAFAICPHGAHALDDSSPTSTPTTTTRKKQMIH